MGEWIEGSGWGCCWFAIRGLIACGFSDDGSR